MRRIFKWAAYVSVGFLALAAWSNGTALPVVTDYSKRLWDIRSAGGAGADQQSYHVDVAVADFDIYGENWDGIGNISGIIGPFFAPIGLTSPPDPTVCIVSMAALAPVCMLREEQAGGARHSHCVDAYRCSWWVSAPARRAFSVVVFDVDAALLSGPWEFVDALLVIPGDLDGEELERLSQRTRNFIANVAPTGFAADAVFKGSPPITFNIGETHRRKADIPVVQLLGEPVDIQLSQSVIYLQ